jgi:hypothetical protein
MSFSLLLLPLLQEVSEFVFVLPVLGTILFVILVPLLIQLFKVLADKKGKAFSVKAMRWVTFILALVFVCLDFGLGGKLAIAVPSAWTPEVVAPFILDVLTQAGLLLTSVIGLYELLMKKLMLDTLSFGTEAELAKRAAG